VKDYDEGGEWQPYYSRAYPEGSEIESEFVPAYDAYSSSQRKAVVIAEAESNEQAQSIVAWLRLLDPDGFGPFARVYELNIQLVFSLENAAVARTLFERWIQKRTDPDDMQQVIRDELHQ
jgi:hypothetical protein